MATCGLVMHGPTTVRGALLPQSSVWSMSGGGKWFVWLREQEKICMLHSIIFSILFGG